MTSPDRPPAYLSRAHLARELDISGTTVDEMVKRGVLPKPMKLSTGCFRWDWRDVVAAMDSLKDGQAGAGARPVDPYLAGAQNVQGLPEGRRGAS